MGIVKPHSGGGKPAIGAGDNVLTPDESGEPHDAFGDEFGVLDQAVRATGYLAGNSFTLADIDLLPTLFYMNKMPESRAMLAQARRASSS